MMRALVGGAVGIYLNDSRHGEQILSNWIFLQPARRELPFLDHGFGMNESTRSRLRVVLPALAACEGVEDVANYSLF